MAYDLQLADLVRDYLSTTASGTIEEKNMFSGLAFLVNDKMCVNISDNNLMCRFDPGLTGEVEKKRGYLPMIMRKKNLQGYCYVAPEGYANQEDFEYWINICLDFNGRAKSSKKKSRVRPSV